MTSYCNLPSKMQFAEPAIKDGSRGMKGLRVLLLLVDGMLVYPRGLPISVLSGFQKVS